MTLSFATNYVPIIGKYSAIQPSLFAIAFYIGKYCSEIPKPKQWGLFLKIGVLLSIPFLILEQIVVGTELHTLIYYYYQAFVSLIVFGIMLLILNHVIWGKLMTDRKERMVKYFDRNSYYIYLCHYWFTAMGLYNIFDTGFTLWNTFYYILLVIIFSILYAFIIESIIYKIKA